MPIRTSLVSPLFVAIALVTACSSTSTPSAGDLDGGTPDAAATDAGMSAQPEDTIVANTYCESIADFFCDFYLRCGRMVARDVAECRAVFDETCNARFEPRYVDLERAKLLTLSRAGVDACARHLARVSCSEQVSDLDGPCGAMWRGTSPAGSRCAIDVESFVCAPGTTCILGLDFCGTCEPAAPRGAECTPGSIRCSPSDACVDGKCVARSLPGQPCSESEPCAVGATCTNGACAAPAIVGEGESCDARRRCAYRAYCEGGTCARASLLGEPCTADRACVSGRCEDGTCVALRSEGETCRSGGECSSGQCVGSRCTPLPSACLGR